jgi:rubrerythrin
MAGRNLLTVALQPMAQRLLPQTLIELYAHSLAIEREAFKRYIELERYAREAGLDYLADEFEKIGREEQEQYEALALGTCDRELPQIAQWEYAWHYLGPQADKVCVPRNAREALQVALSSERRAQNFYIDVAEHANDDSVCAFAAEMAVDEQRHVQRLEQLLAREPEQSKRAEDAELLQP